SHAILSGLALAGEGLHALGVADHDIVRLLGIIRGRVASGVTPARWQRRVLARLLQHHAREEALALLVERYLANAATGTPCHEWSDGA
ncbi:MAG: hypothetical protein U0163_09170, partial [Gemmatimonadaceae bacterium]